MMFFIVLCCLDPDLNYQRYACEILLTCLQLVATGLKFSLAASMDEREERERGEGGEGGWRERMERSRYYCILNWFIELENKRKEGKKEKKKMEEEKKREGEKKEKEGNNIPLGPLDPRVQTDAPMDSIKTTPTTDKATTMPTEKDDTKGEAEPFK